MITRSTRGISTSTNDHCSTESLAARYYRPDIIGRRIRDDVRDKQPAHLRDDPVFNFVVMLEVVAILGRIELR